MNKIKLKTITNFDKAASTYDLNCNIQNNICQDLLTKLKLKKYNNIADFGCGTGESTKSLLQKIDFNNCVATDLSYRSLLSAKNKIKSLKCCFVYADFENEIKKINKLDLLFCNMSLHWAIDHNRTIKLWHKYLKHNGNLLFSIPITGNFPEIESYYNLKLKTLDEWRNILVKNNFTIITQEEKKYIAEFDNYISALRSLKLTGSNYNQQYKTNKLKLIRPDSIFKSQAKPQLTYKIALFFARKNYA